MRLVPYKEIFVRLFYLRNKLKKLFRSKFKIYFRKIEGHVYAFFIVNAQVCRSYINKISFINAYYSAWLKNQYSIFLLLQLNIFRCNSVSK